MKILHVIQSLDPRHGGPPEIAASLAAAQAALDGVHISMVHRADPSDDANVQKLLADVPGFLDRVTLTTLRPAVGNRLTRLLDRDADRTLRRLVRGQDVVHLHNVWDGLLVRAARACRAEGVPYVILINGMLDTWSLAQRALKKRVAMATTHRGLLRRAAAYHCGNDYERETVERLGLGPKTFIVPNGLWLSRVDEAAGASFRSAHPEWGTDPYVLFLSRLHRKKGLDFLLPAFERVAASQPRLRLVVAGPDGGDLALVNDTKAKSPAGDRIHAVGPLYGREKFAALAEAACFCLPSRQEGFPMAVLEALGSRTPAVVSRACHVDEVASAHAGFVVGLDVDEVAQAIDRVIRTPDARTTFGENGRRLVEAKYTWPRVAEASLAMYRALR